MGHQLRVVHVSLFANSLLVEGKLSVRLGVPQCHRQLSALRVRRHYLEETQAVCTPSRLSNLTIGGVGRLVLRPDTIFGLASPVERQCTSWQPAA